MSLKFDAPVTLEDILALIDRDFPRAGWMVSYCTCGQCGPYTASIRSVAGPQPWQAVGRGVTPGRALAMAYKMANSNIAETE